MVKKKRDEEGGDSPSGQLIDPLAQLDLDIQSFDIPRLVSVYPDRAGLRWWTKAWFNNRDVSEPAVEIDKELALAFRRGEKDHDAWLEEYFPRQMAVYHTAIEQTKEQLIQQFNL